MQLIKKHVTYVDQKEHHQGDEMDAAAFVEDSSLQRHSTACLLRILQTSSQYATCSSHEHMLTQWSCIKIHSVNIDLLKKRSKNFHKVCIILFNISTTGMPAYAHPQNCPFTGGSKAPSNTWLHGLTWPHMPNGIVIDSAIFAGYTNVTDRQTDTHTQRLCHKRCSNKLHLYAITTITTTTTVLWPSVRDYPGELVYQKGKPFWILLKQRWWGVSGISWTICKLFALRSRR